MRINDLLPESRLDQIEQRVRREYPGLPDGAIFNTYVEPEGYAEQNGVEIPVPARGVVAILIPNPKWPERMPQYRVVKGRRWLSHWRSYEQQRTRLVNAPDVPLDDFRAAAKVAVEVYRSSKELMN